jgi:hypothetical protein
VPGVLSIVVAISLVLASSTFAQQASQSSKLIRENSPVIALTHVQLIDGTGAAAQADQTIVIDHGKIAAVGSAASTNVPAGAKVIDAKGKTLIPGLVGMHEHLFYPAANDGEPIFIEQPFSFPQLYLASGVTTARTTGSIEPYTDLQVKARVDGGQLPGRIFFSPRLTSMARPQPFCNCIRSRMQRRPAPSSNTGTPSALLR